MTALIRVGMLLSGYLIVFTVNAFEVATEFSAEAVQSVPGQPAMNIKMFVSKKAVRTETNINGNTVVEIVYPNENRRILLNQARKTYVEQKRQANELQKNKNIKGTPCEGIAGAKCKKLSNEKLNKRQTVKWEMTVMRKGNKLKSLHWIDKKRHMPLREQLYDGTVSTMTMVAKEKVNGRNTEKWKFHSVRPNGQFIESLQWYDPKLKMVIREVLPGGYVRELRNIKVARQNKKLFKVPAGYKKENISVTVPSQNKTMNRQAPAKMNFRNNMQRPATQGRVR